MTRIEDLLVPNPCGSNPDSYRSSSCPHWSFACIMTENLGV